MSAGAILDDLLAVAGVPPAADAPGDEGMTLRGADPVFPTPPRAGELGAAAIAAAALAAARLLARRTGVRQRVTGGADVFSQGYRPGALAGLGFAPAEVAALRPGIVYVSMSAFGPQGPWRDRRGYDSVVQSVSGFCDEVAVDGEPRFLPVSVPDYVTGYLAAFGAQVALARRAAEGGSYHVQLSLAQTGRYLAGLPRTTPPERAGCAAELPASRLAELLTETDTPFGRLRHPAPTARMPATPPRWDRPTVPMNHDAPVWE